MWSLRFLFRSDTSSAPSGHLLACTVWYSIFVHKVTSAACLSDIIDFGVSVAHPSSAMPSRNSFLLNSHCVAALNFHATTSMLILAGSRVRSSQNCWIPSMPILFSSWGSAERVRKTRASCNSKTALTLKFVSKLDSSEESLSNTCLCICCRAVPASCGPLRFSWILCNRGLDSGSSCP